MTKKHFLLPFGIITLYLLPLFILGQNSPIMVWDNLDSTVVWFKVLAKSSQIFGDQNSTIPLIMNGLPRVSLGSEFNFILWLYYFFKPFTAYVFNEVMIRFIAFIGMYLLLKKHFSKNFPMGNPVILGVSLVFALLPFWPSGGLSVAGQPLVLFTFLNFRKKESTKKDWLILLLIPFYSSFVLSFVFFIFGLSLLWLYDSVKTKTVNFQFLGALMFMTLVYLILDYRLIYSMFIDPGFVSHRIEFRPEYLSGSNTLLGSAMAGLKNFLLGQPHAPSLHVPFVGAAVLLSLFLILIKKIKANLLYLLLMIAVLISLFHGLWQWIGWLPLKEQFNILRAFQFDRFYFLHPLLWYVIFALSLSLISKNMKYGKKIVLTFVILQILFLFVSNYTVKNLIKDNISPGIVKAPTYKEFYSEKLFDKIKIFIEKKQKDYRVINIGFHPAVAQYNGFYTMDGYLANYPLDYKHKFRTVIEKELAKNELLQKYFDYWGCRFYVFADELGLKTNINKKEKIKIKNLELNTKALKNMGINYIFSAVEILNNQENGLVLLKSFHDNESYYDVYLYKIQ